MKILTVVGARPQFVKAAVVSRAIQAHNAKNSTQLIVEEILHTGQHYDASMSDVFFEEMRIPRPHANLHVGSGSHGAATAAMLKGIEDEIFARQPHVVLVYGDTNSTLAGALAAVKLHVPVAHVEAGLRSFNRRMPEEINRVMTDHVSSLLFPCSERSRTWLADEGITSNVFNVGDVMFDAYLAYAPQAKWPAAIPRPQGPYSLATVHRADNTDDKQRLRALMQGFAALPCEIVLPLHPRTRSRLKEHAVELPKNVLVYEPQGYFELMALLKDCRFVLTDSGGLQKEAYFAGKRALVLRDETEWVELVEQDVNRLVGCDEAKLKAAWDWAMQELRPPQGIYGDGQAGQKIVSTLLATPLRV